LSIFSIVECKGHDFIVLLIVISVSCFVIISVSCFVKMTCLHFFNYINMFFLNSIYNDGV